MSLWVPSQLLVPTGVEPDPGAPQPVLFLDRDGVVIHEHHYLHDPELVTLIPGSAAAMRLAREHGFRLVGISNQSGIGRGLFTEEDFKAVQRRLDSLLAEKDVGFDAFYYCPHAPENGCRCRKPAPGLLAEASLWIPWDPALSWVVGDKISDVEMARAAGMAAILVRTGYGREQERKLEDHDSVFVFDDLAAAVHFITAEAGV